MQKEIKGSTRGRFSDLLEKGESSMSSKEVSGKMTEGMEIPMGEIRSSASTDDCIEPRIEIVGCSRRQWSSTRWFHTGASNPKCWQDRFPLQVVPCNPRPNFYESDFEPQLPTTDIGVKGKGVNKPSRLGLGSG